MTDDAFDPTKTDAETHDDAGDDEAVASSSPLGAASTGNGNANDNKHENASDDEHGIIGEEA